MTHIKNTEAQTVPEKLIPHQALDLSNLTKVKTLQALQL